MDILVYSRTDQTPHPTPTGGHIFTDQYNLSNIEKESPYDHFCHYIFE